VDSVTNCEWNVSSWTRSKVFGGAYTGFRWWLYPEGKYSQMRKYHKGIGATEGLELNCVVEREEEKEKEKVGRAIYRRSALASQRIVRALRVHAQSLELTTLGKCCLLYA